MKVPHIIGADLSKQTIDFASHQCHVHFKAANNAQGFKDFTAWLKKLQVKTSQVFVVMEHTGLYSYQFEQFLHARPIQFVKVPALQIKRSMGMVRGKSDKQDAFRIAEYGYEKADRLVPAKAEDKVLQRLRMLHTTRSKLVGDRAAYYAAVQVYQDNCKLSQTDPVIKCQINLIKALDREILKLDQTIESIIEDNNALCQNYHLLLSIKGVGKVVAVAMLVKTQNFTRFTNARKFACYCGTAPFENSSGTSIRGRTRVSHLADKSMKTLLDLSAKSAIQYARDIKEYYVRKTKEGKPKMSTINAVRNKILYRMFAVIKRQTPYQETMSAA